MEPDALENAGAALAATMRIVSGIGIIVAILMIISMWKIYVKAEKPGWASIVPIYQILVLLEIIGKPWWWLLLYLIPFVNIIFLIWTINLLSKSFGNGVGFTLGLLFLSVIFYPVLAFGGAKYQGPAGKQ
jgi:hypothetical protein